MSYNKIIGQNTGGWSPQGQQPAGAGVWQQPYNVAPQNLQSFGVPSSAGGDVRPQHNAMLMAGRPPYDMGVMGPPPIPQQPANASLNVNHSMMMTPSFRPHMMPRNPLLGFPAPMVESGVVAGTGGGPNRHPVRMPFTDSPMYPGSRMPAYIPYSDTHNPPPPTLPVDNSMWKTNAAHRPGNENLTLDKNKQHADNNMTFQTRYNELFNRMPAPTNSEDLWKAGLAPKVNTMLPQRDRPVITTANTTTNSNLSTAPCEPALPSDLKGISVSLFTNKDGNSSQHTRPVSVPPISAGLPPSEELLAVRTTSKVLNMDETSTGLGSDKDKPKRRRRKRCGECEPCMRKEDCGACYVCKNKGQVNAICKSRKCILLRQKAGGGPLSESGTSEVSLTDQPAADALEPMMRPTTQRMLPANLSAMANIPSIPLGIAETRGFTSSQPSAAPTIEGSSFYPSQVAHERAMARSDLPHIHPPSALLPSQTIYQHSTTHSTSSSSAPSASQPTVFSAPPFSSQPYHRLPTKSSMLPWACSPAKPSAARGGGWSKSYKQISAAPPVRSSTTMSAEKLNDLYSTFKDDMQKMNERTFVRANGVQVCKLMTKLLSLNITDTELKSSHPPKPLAGSWEQLMPDIKSMDGVPLNKLLDTSSRSELPSNTPVKVAGEGVVPREIVSHRTSDPEVTNSQGATSDIEDTQAVDSGFSSSSPADRQSPSPKVLLDTLGPAGEKEAVSAGDSVTQSIASQHMNADTTSHSSSQSEQLHEAKTDVPWTHLHKGQGRDECALDLSANSTSFPRVSPTGFPSHQPLNNQSPAVQAQESFTQTSTAHSWNTGSNQTHSNMVNSVNQLISSLSAQVTGSVKQEQPQELDVSYLIKHNKIAEPPNCGCVHKAYDENIEGPYYIHLGAANSIRGIREMMEERTGLCGEAVRIEKVRYTTKEGRTSQGCPAAKWILRRVSVDEKVLVVTKHRPGHYCATAWIIIAIALWEGVPEQAANHMYDYLTRTLPVYGYETERRCGTNQPRDCACQGWDTNRKGASFSFGCSWSVYYNGCKFARSQIPRKFKLRDQSFEGVMESKFQALGQHLAPLYKQMAPVSYGAQVRYEGRAGDCRIGFRTGRPFSGCTATVDFCAHQHKDTHNMNNGCTVVVTLTKHRGLSKPDDEQLHALPMYCLDDTDEHESTLGIQKRIANGSIEVLNSFSQEQRRRSRPYKKRKKGAETYQSPKVKEAFVDSIKEKLSRDTKNISSLASPAPSSHDREAAKHDLFNNTQDKPLPHGLQPAAPPPNFPQSNLHIPSTAPSAHFRSQQLPASLPDNAAMYSFTDKLNMQHQVPHQVPQQVPQHMQSIKLEECTAPLPSTNSNSTSTTTSLPSSSATATSGESQVPADSAQTTTVHAATDIDENDEGLKPPKPRPPSPEFDDPEGMDIHQENDHLFKDPNVGGVAFALQHGTVLFEVAKRELHATTALKQPDRYNPTRISLVFYQHKRLNCAKHGYHEYRKAEEERQKARAEALRMGVEYIPKGLKYKQKRMQEAAQRKALINGSHPSTHPPLAKHSGIRKKPGRKAGWKQRKNMRFAIFQYLWPLVVNHPKALTSTTTITNWVKPQCIITGPYQKWVSLHDSLAKSSPKSVIIKDYKPPPLPSSVSSTLPHSINTSTTRAASFLSTVTSTSSKHTNVTMSNSTKSATQTTFSSTTNLVRNPSFGDKIMTSDNNRPVPNKINLPTTTTSSSVKNTQRNFPLSTADQPVTNPYAAKTIPGGSQNFVTSKPASMASKVGCAPHQLDAPAKRMTSGVTRSPVNRVDSTKSLQSAASLNSYHPSSTHVNASIVQVDRPAVSGNGSITDMPSSAAPQGHVPPFGFWQKSGSLTSYPQQNSSNHQIVANPSPSNGITGTLTEKSTPTSVSGQKSGLETAVNHQFNALRNKPPRKSPILTESSVSVTNLASPKFTNFPPYPLRFTDGWPHSNSAPNSRLLGSGPMAAFSSLSNQSDSKHNSNVNQREVIDNDRAGITSNTVVKQTPSIEHPHR